MKAISGSNDAIKTLIMAKSSSNEAMKRLPLVKILKQ
jgi:hypothetical protein